MLQSKNILIVDANIYQTIDLSGAIEAVEGRVAGVVTTVEEVADVLKTCIVHGAVIDCQLPEASAVVMLLHEQDVAMVLQVGPAVPEPLRALDGKVSILPRPAACETVLNALSEKLS